MLERPFQSDNTVVGAQGDQTVKDISPDPLRAENLFNVKSIDNNQTPDRDDLPKKVILGEN